MATRDDSSTTTALTPSAVEAASSKASLDNAAVATPARVLAAFSIRVDRASKETEAPAKSAQQRARRNSVSGTQALSPPTPVATE